MTTTALQTVTAVPDIEDATQRELIVGLLRGVENIGGRDTIQTMMTVDERNVVSSRARKLMAVLRPIDDASAEKRTAGAMIAEMMAMGFPNFKADKPGETVGAYVMQLRSMPLFAIQRACDDVLNGRVDGLNPDFPPSGVRMLQVAQRHVGPFQFEQDKIKRLLACKVVREAEFDNPGARKRIGDGFKAAAEELGKITAAAEEAARSKHAAEAREHNDKLILREYAAAGVKPVRAENGQLVSLGLSRMLGQHAKDMTRHVETRRDDL